MNLARLLIRWGALKPDQPALFFGPTVWATFGQWTARAAALAQAFRAMGLMPGDRVLLFAQNHPRYLEVLIGCWWAGLVAIPVNARLHPKEVQWIIDNAKPRIGFFHQTCDSADFIGLEKCFEFESAALDALVALAVEKNSIAQEVALHDTVADDTAWLFYTSGTTGRPKGVQITARNLMTMGLCYFTDVDSVTPDDFMVYAAPMSHGAGLYCIPHLMAGARHVVPQSGGVDPAELFSLGHTLGPLSTFAAPTIVKRLVEHAVRAGLSTDACAAAFKTIVYGGAPMYVADIERALQVMGPRFVQIYGQGETPMVATALSRRHLIQVDHPRYRARIASVGIAQTAVQIRIADAQGTPLPVGEVGEILVKGDTVMRGYWQDPEATRAAIRDSWLFTGDVGCLDEDGFLTLKDRSKDLIISGGSNIYPREVEEVLMSAAGVAEAAVIGEPDPQWGEAVVAFIVPAPGAQIEPAALDRHCQENIARFKRPKRYIVITTLPKNNYGKVLKTVLRAQHIALNLSGGGHG
jgi:long-chain acyl-CoA synthetase